MAHRDDLAAHRHRIESLERSLADARREADALRRGVPLPPAPDPRPDRFAHGLLVGLMLTGVSASLALSRAHRDPTAAPAPPVLATPAPANEYAMRMVPLGPPGRMARHDVAPPRPLPVRHVRWRGAITRTNQPGLQAGARCHVDGGFTESRGITRVSTLDVVCGGVAVFQRVLEPSQTSGLARVGEDRYTLRHNESDVRAGGLRVDTPRRMLVVDGAFGEPWSTSIRVGAVGEAVAPDVVQRP
ncbi:MAG: hypothetical protein R3A48_06040 [Polyangiales bacterium]